MAAFNGTEQPITRSLTPVNWLSAHRRQQRHANIPFQSTQLLTLDLYRPLTANGSAPVIVFFYGGSWQRGSKDAYAFVASQLTRQGFVVVIPNYRLYPAVQFPAFVHDAAAAVHWVIGNVAQYGGDPEQLFLMGHSAGAQIAALLHYDATYLGSPQNMATHKATYAAGLIGLSGPYDFLPLTSSTLQEVFPEPARAASQPINCAHGNASPALLLHGAADQTVRPGNAVRLARRIEEQGGVATTKIYQGRGHVGMLLALARPLRRLAPVVTDLVEFVREQTARP